MPASSLDVWEVIAYEAAAESPLWAEALRPEGERELEAIFSPLLAEARYAVGLETIYEGYLLHYGRPRLFAPKDGHSALLLGDYLYAHGLVRVAAQEGVDAIADLAALISRCSQLRADALPGDGEAWAATAVFLGQAPLAAGRNARETASGDAVDHALSLHAARLS